MGAWMVQDQDLHCSLAGHQIILEVEGMQFFLDEKVMQFSFSFFFYLKERRENGGETPQSGTL